jgi:multiple sugar transport system permease protein
VASVEILFKRSVFRAVLIYTALLAIACFWLFPIAWAVSGSLKSGGEISEPILFPAHPRWSNYTEVFTLMPFWRMFFNTVFYAGCITAGQVFFCSLAGYAFARLQFRGRDTLFVLYLGTLMVPLTVTVIPQFIIMRVLGWTDTPWAMIVPGLFGGAFGTYLMRQFFSTLPTDLEEAATLDGCTPWQIYWRILLPHARPAVAVLAVLTWVGVWNDFADVGPGPDAGGVRRPLAADNGDVDAHHAAVGDHLCDRAALVCPWHRRHGTQRVRP